MSNFVGLNRRIRVVAFAAALTVVGVSSALAQAPAGGESRSRKTSRRYFSEAARTVIALTGGPPCPSPPMKKCGHGRAPSRTGPE